MSWRSVRGWLELRPGERVLDVGVGSGFLTAEMAGEVGADGMAAGIDVSENMLALDLPTVPADVDEQRVFVQHVTTHVGVARAGQQGGDLPGGVHASTAVHTRDRSAADSP